MIGIHCNWSGLPLAAPLADRFANSLGVGLAGGTASRTVGGVTFAGSLRSGRAALQLTVPLTGKGHYVLFKGYIDNREELLRMLPVSADVAVDDAKLYGLCHDAWGDECDLKVVGQYASILCSPEAKTIRIASSPIQAPPLHIWKDAERVIIASTARAVFATGEAKQEIDEQKIADSLFLNYKEGTRGWFRGVSCLPAGRRALISPIKMEMIGYYDPFASGPIRLKSDQDYVDQADALFEEGTRSALRGFSRPAVSLSGGYDSQAVAASALSVMPEGRRLLGFSSIPEPGWDGRSRPKRFGDESDHVKAFAHMHPTLDLEFIDAAGLSFDYKLEALFLMAGVAPRNAMNLHWIHEIRSRAKAANCDVLLTGAMGNNTFSFEGRGALTGWLRSGAWMRLAKEVWAIRREHATVVHAFAAKAVLPLLSAKTSAAVSKWRGGKQLDVFERWCPLNRDWAEELGVAERAKKLGFDPSFKPFPSTAELKLAMLDNAGNEGGDMRQGMELIHGVASRDPTSYRPLLEFCFNIPDDQYVRNGQKRWLAKRMLKGKVPDMVLNETRRGQQAADWHLRLGRQRKQLREEIEELAASPKVAAMLNLPRLRKTLDEWPDRTPTHKSDPNSAVHLALTRGLTTARFIRFVEGDNR